MSEAAKCRINRLKFLREVHQLLITIHKTVYRPGAIIHTALW